MIRLFLSLTFLLSNNLLFAETSQATPKQKWQFRIVKPWNIKEIRDNPNCYKKNEKTYCEQLKAQGLLTENTNCEFLIKAFSKKDYQEPCDNSEEIKNLDYCDVLKRGLAHTEFFDLTCKNDSCESLKAKLNTIKETYNSNSCYRTNSHTHRIPSHCRDLKREFEYTKSIHDRACYHPIKGLAEEYHTNNCEFLRNNHKDIYDMVCGNNFYSICFHLWKKNPLYTANGLAIPPELSDIHFNCVLIQPPETITMEDLAAANHPFIMSIENRYQWMDYWYLTEPHKQPVSNTFKINEFPFLNPPYQLPVFDNSQPN